MVKHWLLFLPLCLIVSSCNSLTVKNHTYIAEYDETTVNYLKCDTAMTTDIILEEGEMIIDCVVSPADVYAVRTSVSTLHNQHTCHIILTRLKNSFYDGSLVITTDRRTYHITLLNSSYEEHMPIYRWKY